MKPQPTNAIEHVHTQDYWVRALFHPPGSGFYESAARGIGGTSMLLLNRYRNAARDPGGKQ